MRKSRPNPLIGGDRAGWSSFRLKGGEKREIQKALVKAGVPADPVSKFNRLFAGIETLVNYKHAIEEGDHEERLTPKEIKQEIARLQDSIDHLQKNLLLLYGDGLQDSVEDSLDAALILDSKMAKPAVFIQRLSEDLQTLNAALQRTGEDFKIQRGRPYHPKGIKTFLAVELAKVYQNALGVAPTSTQYNSDAQTKDSPFVFLLHRVYKLCDLDITDAKPYALKAIRQLK